VAGPSAISNGVLFHRQEKRETVSAWAVELRRTHALDAVAKSPIDKRLQIEWGVRARMWAKQTHGPTLARTMGGFRVAGSAP
jgi:hypothetical protein